MAQADESAQVVHTIQLMDVLRCCVLRTNGQKKVFPSWMRPTLGDIMLERFLNAIKSIKGNKLARVSSCSRTIYYHECSSSE